MQKAKGVLYIALWANFFLQDQAHFWQTDLFQYEKYRDCMLNKNNYTTMLFMTKQVILPKISSIPQKIKISPNCYIGPFCMKAFNNIIDTNHS